MVVKCIICFIVGACFGLMVTSLATISSISSYKEKELDRFKKAFDEQRKIMNKNVENLREKGVKEMNLEDLFEGTVFITKKL